MEIKPYKSKRTLYRFLDELDWRADDSNPTLSVWKEAGILKDHYSTLFTYCFHRFGPPNAPHDPDKHLAVWNLSIGAGVIAELLFCSYGHLFLIFYSHAKTLRWRMEKEKRGWMWAYYNNKYLWIKKRYKYAFHSLARSDIKLTPRRQRMFDCFNKWVQEHNETRFKDWEDTEENWGKAYRLFVDEVEAEMERIGKDYPIAAPETNPNPTPLQDKYLGLMQDFITELKRPVWVRDTAFNCLGCVPSEDAVACTECYGRDKCYCEEEENQ